LEGKAEKVSTTTGIKQNRSGEGAPKDPELSDEEELAGRAIAQIRGWLEEEEESGGEGFIPRLAIKFCGGCNPLIERSFLAETVRKKLAGAVCWVSWEETPDLVLIINGCLTACADRADIQKKARAILEIQGLSLTGVENIRGRRRQGGGG
jgi:hypothetical protein